jgi:cytoskeletal protein RodZ
MGQLGDTLRERRSALGISLEQAEEATRIRGKLLAALEAGDYARLPNPGYVRGYVSSYAKYLELDPVPLLAMYRSETGAGRYHDINLVDDEAVAPRGQQHAIPWKAALIAVLAIALVAAAIWVGLRLTAKPTTLAPIPAGTTTSTPAAGQPTGPGAPAASAPSHVKVSVAANSASAVTITLDGQPFYKGSLTGGQSKEFDLTQSAVLVIARPSAVTVVQDGAKVKLPTTEPATITLKTAPAK